MHAFDAFIILNGSYSTNVTFTTSISVEGPTHADTPEIQLSSKIVNINKILVMNADADIMQIAAPQQFMMVFI